MSDGMMGIQGTMATSPFFTVPSGSESLKAVWHEGIDHSPCSIAELKGI